MLFRDDEGSVVVKVLDFGLVKRFDATEIQVLERMLTAMVLERDIAAYRRTIEEIGMLKPGASFTDAEVEVAGASGPQNTAPAWRTRGSSERGSAQSSSRCSGAMAFDTSRACSGPSQTTA